ncbi:uncharacterized protein LOC142771849 isoform X2 [Rhipicephalus microplus]|uniref:uncharacterized protein LOC142771849 isoform X2 n=1 Tax=Rhipicephalus microplus TaxID=6941 RepID=UPI003F6A5694
MLIPLVVLLVCASCAGMSTAQRSTTASVPVPRVDRALMNWALEQGLETQQHIWNITEPALFSSGVAMRPGQPPWFLGAMGKTKVISKNISALALITEQASRNLARQLGLSPRDVTFGLTKVDVRGTLAQALCPYKTGRFAPPCSAQRFRSYDGYCNNLQNPYWGSANLRYLRFLPPNYADGISAVRVDSRGGQLPSARTVSASMFLDQDRPHDHASMMTIAWGKFIFHDIAHTAQSAGFEGSRVKCCNVAAGFEHPECMPIDVPAQDPYYGRFGQRCLEYVRSSAAPRETCGLGPREQNNQVTSFLDGSTIYGSSEAEVKFLRAFEGGQLLSQRTPAGEELPPADLATLDCRRGSQEPPCFSSGDPRVNADLGLAMMHTVWLREHNRVARSLQGLNPQWDDERTFQEARRIVGAEMQFITYNEFLPALLGPEVVERFGLRLENQGYSQGYDPRRLPGVTNVMAAAGVWAMASAAPAQRLGSLPETAFRPQELYSRLKQIAAGALMQHAQKMDNFISRHVTQDMFASSNREAGVDLAAVAIQQGRDHGLAGYTRWRQFCGLRPIDDFDGLSRVMSSDAAFRLSQLYPTVHDVDLLPAALAETPVEGGLVGPTLACIYAHQFRHLRVSDRFWFENADQPSSFTEDQLRELRKTSLARVLCDNVFFRSGGGVVQPRTMRVPDPWLNNLMSCEDRLLTDVDLDAWQEGSRLLNVPDSVLQDALADLAASQGGQFGRFNSRGGFMRATSGSRSIHNQSEALELATRRLLKAMKKGESKQDVIPALRQVDLSKFATEFEEPAACEEETLGPCDPRTPFRTLSGRCNNLRRPNLGKVGHSFRRVLPGLYEDGVSAPRSRSVTGTALPSPRLVSFAVHGDTSRPHQRYTMMLMQLGQFVDHDIAHTPLAEGPNGETLRCRACDSPRRINKECFPIRIPKNDPHFPSVSRKNPNIPQCLPFTRSMSGQRTLGSREQINQVTGYMDLSTVYGSDDCAREELRLFRGGLLNMSAHPAGVQFKPLLSEVDGAADCISSNGRCFIAGDTRVSEQPGLTSMHTIMSREHNRVARSLQLLNPHWNDDRLFQEARRIVGAMYQRIVYSEFIPRTLGWESVSRWGLNLLDEGYYTGYDPNCDVGSFNEFATAAFRFGHTLLPPVLKLVGPAYDELGGLKLTDAFFNSQTLYRKDRLDQLLRGLLSTPMENFDNHVTKMVTNHLFESKTVPFSGLDLVAINLQRGRDHGLRTYNDYRSFCGLSRARSWSDLEGHIPRTTLQAIAGVYRDVEDVDVFTGGLSEFPLAGAVVGPTFSCLLGFQFQRLRRCDRFWHENGDAVTRFTPDQLAQIRKASLAKIICQNSDTTRFITRKVLDVYDPFLNPRVSCGSIQDVDLNFWRANLV